MSSESSSGSSPRPVARRESPWGMSEGDHKQPTPHRCNDRVEDVIQVPNLVAFGKVLQSTKNSFDGILHSFDACFEVFVATEKTVLPFSEEPTEPFGFLQLDPSTREVKLD
ncbi:hypothetical protein RHGRI_009978 [Rhododendron griersonianum]|uniref:Uncharacterized protein n=1 Tax=Rhododendron griersonianum TaxID=479676 RepID=A0AAV6KI00_9ERIC|nr:hypothetical protein RHGRI_009978 [Rhododendron griersonianum]